MKYHAEGDKDSIFARAEIAQIENVIIMEREISQQSWMDMISTAGMRRRTFIAAALGLFTQWSGNTLISFYLSKILDMIGITDANTKSYINLGNTAWSFVNGTTIALVVPRFPRRTMFLIGATGMLVIYIAWYVYLGHHLTLFGVQQILISHPQQDNPHEDRHDSPCQWTEERRSRHCCCSLHLSLLSVIQCRK